MFAMRLAFALLTLASVALSSGCGTVMVLSNCTAAGSPTPT